MFQGKSLSEAIKIFIEKFGYAKENKDEISITVMTKDNEKELEIYRVIENEIKSFDQNYTVLSLEPSFDELEKYSSEVVYNLKASLTKDDLGEIGNKVYLNVKKYVDDKIIALNLDKLTDEEKVTLLKEKQAEGYFLDYKIIDNNQDFTFLDNTNYKVAFIFEDDLTYTYNIILNLEVEKEINNEDKKVIEDYLYEYTFTDDTNVVNNLKTYFYEIKNK